MKKYASPAMIKRIQSRADVVVEALPYIERFARRKMVVKVGGEVVDRPEQVKSLVEDLVLLNAIGIQVALCHGGGPQISRLMQQVGQEPVFHDGLRVTDAATLECVAMALLGGINRQLVAQLNTKRQAAIGLSGLDNRLFVARPRSPELGLVGEIEKVNAAVVVDLLERGCLPVVASLGIDDAGQVYNINADAAAAELAGAIGAEKLIVLTNVAGIYERLGDPETLFSQLSAAELTALLDSRAVGGGMIPKSRAALRALELGVKRAHILDGRLRHALLLEMFTADGVGTMVGPVDGKE